MRKVKKYLLFAALVFSTGIAVRGNEKVDFKGPKISSMVFNDMKMGDVARLITNTTGVPIIVSKAASEIKIDIEIKDAYCFEILPVICKANGMWFSFDPGTGIAQIQTAEELKSNLTMYNDDFVETVTLLYPKVEDIGEVLQKLFVDRVVWFEPDKKSGDAYDAIQRAIDRMELLTDTSAMNLWDEASSNSSGSSNNNTSNNRNNNRNNNNNSNNNRSSDSTTSRSSLLKELTDDGSKPVSTSAQSILEVFSNYGVKMNQQRLSELTGNPQRIYLAALPSTNSLLMRSPNRKSLEQIKKLVKELDKPSPQVLLEVKLLSVSLNDTNARAIDFLFEKGDVSGGFADGLGSSTGQLIQKPDSNLVPTGTGVDSSAFIFNAVTSNFRARVQLLKQEGRITELATPNLLVSDSEASRIFLGKEASILENIQTTSTRYPTAGGTDYTQDVSTSITAPRRRIGVSLFLTPKIHADRTVTLRLMQERSSIGDTRTIKLNSELQSESFDSQDINLQTLTTTVVGKDNNFIVIGGLIEEKVQKEQEKVPGLCDIPLIGELLFTRINQVRARSELVVVIRPFILMAPGEGQQVAQSFLERISQHPSASKDLPELGITFPQEQAKGKTYNPNDPWHKKLLYMLDTWQIDTDNRPEVEHKLYDLTEEQDIKRANQKIKKIEHDKNEL